MAPNQLDAPALVATDVDGTLLDEHDRITPRTRAAVNALVSAGVPFVLATGRPPRWIPPVVDALGVAPLSVCGNGAIIYDAATDQVLSSVALDEQMLTWVAELALERLPGIGLAVERVPVGAFIDADAQFLSAPGYEHAWPSPDNTEVPLDQLLDAPAFKLLIRNPHATSAELRAALAPAVGDKVDLTYSTNKGLLEVSAPGITKGAGLAWVAERLGVPTERVAAFGDMPNDVPMLELAGHGVAVSNAHPHALAVANEVTTANHDFGVARVLERWWR